MTATATREAEWAGLFARAHEAGAAAAKAARPRPVVFTVEGGGTKESFYEPDGLCGFAWVTLKPGTSAVARYAKRVLGFKPGYGGGVSVWVGDYGQSVARKEAYARAYAKVLTEAGITAYADSRLD